MEMFRFAHPEYFWGFLVIPLLIALFILYRITRKRALKKFGDPEIVETLMPSASRTRPTLKFILTCWPLPFSSWVQPGHSLAQN